MTEQPSDVEDRMFPPSRQPRGNHFLPGDFVEYLSLDRAPHDGYVPLGTPGVVLDLTDAVAVTAVWTTRDGGLVYDEVYDQDHLGRITAEEFLKRNKEIRNGKRPPAQSRDGWGQPMEGYPDAF